MVAEWRCLGVLPLTFMSLSSSSLCSPSLSPPTESDEGGSASCLTPEAVNDHGEDHIRSFSVDSILPEADEDLVAGLRSLSVCSLVSATSDDSATSSICYDLDFEAIIDNILSENVGVLVDPHSFIKVCLDSADSQGDVMVKRFSRTSSELLFYLELNCAEQRLDPWNPTPRILRAVERQDDVFLCFEPLLEYNQPPFQCVANYVDFFRQCLEGLVFLHEQNISSLSYSEPSSFLIDIGAWSATVFDRATYPVCYYYNDFSKAIKTESRARRRNDLQDFGVLMERILLDVPTVEDRFRSFVIALKSGELSADEARELFELLSKSFDAAVFDTPAGGNRTLQCAKPPLVVIL